MNPKVNFFFQKETKWKKEVQKLRKIVLDCQLTEELKWGCPCYTLQNGNIVLIHVFKEYCALLFFKGALLQNQFGILIQQSENVQAARQIRFKGLSEIESLEVQIKATIYEAIEVEKSGLKVELKKTSDFEMPDEFALAIKEDHKLNESFKSLTPGRQRAYLLYFSSPKQGKTRKARIEKCIPQILNGKGLND